MRNETESGSAVNVRSGAHLVTGQQRVVCSGSTVDTLAASSPYVF